MDGAISRRLCAGVFFVSLATLMLELLLTRIWSVTMWYHFAFVSISIAMFGMTVGAIAVYLLPVFFSREKVLKHLFTAALAFSMSIVLSFLTQLSMPFFPDRSLVGIFSLGLLYIVVSTPFVLSGICITLALTKLPQFVERTYASDLCGAALGCLTLLWVLNFTDGPTAVFFSALCAAVGSLCFLPFAGGVKLRSGKAAICWCILLLLFCLGNSYLVGKQSSVLRLIWVKGRFEEKPLYEKWNTFSRVAVFGDPNALEEPFFWGGSPTFLKPPVKQLHMTVDAFYSTVMPHFVGDLSEVEYLKYDVTNIAHYLRNNAYVLIVGSGGGRDVLSSLAFGQRKVKAVEINGNALEAVNGRFGDFTGHLDRNPKVEIVNDEARSYISRQNDHFDIIQLSVIDTGAATGSGAYALTENSLYTREAWSTFLDKLTPDGIITCSRWYYPEMPGEIYRLCALARSALKQVGVADPGKCIVIVKSKLDTSGPKSAYIATVLVSRSPFSSKDLIRIEEISKKLDFEIVYSPEKRDNTVIADIVDGENLERLAQSLPVRIDAPSDDSPFFFYMLKRAWPGQKRLFTAGTDALYTNAETMLSQLSLVVAILTASCILLPLKLSREKIDLRKEGSLLLFFSLIGFGFMFVEISQLQRLIIFLGHPSLGLSVVLFTLLFSGGIGCLCTQLFAIAASQKRSAYAMASLPTVLMVFGVGSAAIFQQFSQAQDMERILVAASMLFPVGFFMGMAMPCGLRLASSYRPALMPWLWGANGATSVMASVLAVFVAVSFGIAASFWLGVACYVLAVLCYFVTIRQSQHVL